MLPRTVLITPITFYILNIHIELMPTIDVLTETFDDIIFTLLGLLWMLNKLVWIDFENIHYI